MTRDEYKKNAQECRELARRMPRREDRERLERMAEAWEELAEGHQKKSAPGFPRTAT